MIFNALICGNIYTKQSKVKDYWDISMIYGRFHCWPETAKVRLIRQQSSHTMPGHMKDLNGYKNGI